MIKEIEEVLTRFEGNKVFTLKNTKEVMSFVRRELMDCYERGFNQGYEEGIKYKRYRSIDKFIKSLTHKL